MKQFDKMSVLKKSKWIWIAAGETADQYAEFYDCIPYNGQQTVMNLSCDSDYTLYVNGKYVASNQYGDFEHYKIYDTIDLTAFLNMGENVIKILVYHCGVNTSRYRPARAGVIYEVLSNERIVTYSCKDILSRLSPTYANGKKIPVSGQLGFTFSYDATADTEEGYVSSVEVEKQCVFYPRPIQKAQLLERSPIKKLTRLSDTHWLIDLGGEVVGVPTLEIVSDTEQPLTIAWGEHLEDGCVRKKIGGRNFFYQYKTQKGHNLFTDYMLRIGCRYLEVFAEAPIEVLYVGLFPQVYETETLPYQMEDPLDRRIYDICVNTLKLCMMEHYVDSPWREQALYAFDARNQMLCGYYAFKDGNAAYARANLKLIGEDRRDDGLLSICYPCGTKLAIPSFSLYYLLAMREYINHTGDTDLAAEMLPKMKGICEEFFANSQNGLIQKFVKPKMWNFYDWSQYSEGDLSKPEEAVADLVINCLFVIALDCFAYICDAVKAEFPYPMQAQKLRVRIREEFLTDNGIYTMHKGKAEYTVLGNTLAILAGVTSGDECNRLCEKLVSGELVECSLSMKVLEYEALLNTDTETYRNFVLKEIRSNYKRMLDFGSNTVWETINGASDFDNAGSLCHGWSAVPIIYYHRLLANM